MADAYLSGRQKGILIMALSFGKQATYSHPSRISSSS